MKGVPSDYSQRTGKRRLPSRASVAPKLKDDCDRMIQIIRKEPTVTPEDLTLVAALVTVRALL